jgi:[protein-PII] uridylyltransferase
VAELQVVDRLGLLYDLFMAIGKLDLSVTHARISTEKGVAIDAIYIQNAAGDKLRDKEELDTLKQALEAAVFQQAVEKDVTEATTK